MRGNRRARASLALIATPDTSLLSGTAQWYNIGAGFRYRYGRLRTEVLEQAVKGKFLLDAEVTVPHGGGEFRVPRRRGFVGLVVVPPRPPIHPVTHRIGDPNAAPVEVAVVAESCETAAPPRNGLLFRSDAQPRAAAPGWRRAG